MRNAIEKRPSKEQTEPEVVQSQLRSFEGEQLSATISEQLKALDDFWNGVFYSRPRDLVRIAYLGILGREPDIGGSTNYASLLGKKMDFVALLKELLSSDEFLIKNSPVRSGLPKDVYHKLIQIKPYTPTHEYLYLAAMAAKISLLKKDDLKENKPKLYIMFSFADKKEKDCLFPLVTHLREVANSHIEILFLDIFAAIDFYARNYSGRFIFIGAIDKVKSVLDGIGLSETFVYVEHGVAPLKNYTYAPHYRRYNYSLLPGDLWCERLGILYSELKGRLYPVGFPKLDIKQISWDDRLAYCKRFNLDAAKKIILFAPTWSAGNKEAGIFNVRYLQGVPNVITIPHDGDKPYAEIMRREGFLIHNLEDESISYHYAFADLLISDYSSTVIEFLRIGKPAFSIRPVVCIDYHKCNVDEDGFSKIPETSYKWDFCPVYDREDLKREIEVFLEKGICAVNMELVGKMCESYGSEATEKAVAALASIIKTEFGTDILAK